MNFRVDFESLFDKYDRETILDTIQSLTKITARSISLAGYFDFSPELAEGKEAVAGIQCVFTIRSTFNSIGKIVNQVKRKEQPELTETLKTAASTIGVATGLLSIFKFCTTQKDILKLLSQVSSSLGGTSVVGEALYSTLFLNHIASALGLIQSVITITVDCIYIHERNKKIDRAREKMTFWQQPLDEAEVHAKIGRITHKYSILADNTESEAVEFIRTCQKAKAAIQKYQEQKAAYKQSSGLKKISTWAVLKSRKRTAKKRVIKNQKQADQLNDCLNKQLKAFSNLKGWQKIHAKWDHLSDNDLQKLATTQQDKAAKWQVKKKNLKVEQIKAGVGLALKIIGLIVTIAALILSATGVGIVPVLITMTTISLVLALTSFGFTLFKRHTSPLKVHGVPPPRLA